MPDKNLQAIPLICQILFGCPDALAMQAEASGRVRILTPSVRQYSAPCNVVGLADGAYQVEWYDTSSGRILRRDTASVDHLTHFGHGIELKPPEFWGDIAARVIRKGRKS